MLIETKLQPPHLRDVLVERSRLLRILDAATVGKLAVVSSPAGFGKSTLLSQWAASISNGKGRVAWLSIDRLDNDLARFLKYLAAAFQRVDPSIAENAELLIDSSPITPVDSILTSIINELSRRSAPIYLVLDDAHLIVSNDIAAFLNMLLAYSPSTLHIVLATRGELPLELANMKMKGQVVSLSDSDLRFSLDETEDYLKNVSGIDLAISAIVALHHKTEGWPAGLQLASLALAHEGSKEAFIAEFSGSQRDVSMFLAQDVLARQTPEIQDFLLRTSILDRFCLGLVEVVCPEHDCAAALATIEHSNLFLIALDSSGQWFRYHHLFSEFLRNKLDAWAPEIRTGLHRSAASWLAAKGYVSDAVDHALACSDKDLAARLVEECAMPVIMQGHIPRLTEWLNQLPADLIVARPRLLLARVWAQFQMSRPHEAVRILKQAKTLIRQLSDRGEIDRATTRTLKAELQTLTAGVISATDRSRTAARLATRWLADFPEDEPFARGTLANICAFSHYSLGELDAARLLSLKARDYQAVANSVFGIVYGDLLLGLVEISAGNLADAHDILDRACRLAREHLGSGSYPEAMTAIFQVELAYEWNDLQGAERILHQHRQIIEECGLVVHEMACKLHLARLAAAHGRHDEAIVFLERAERLGIEKRYRRLTAAALNERVRLLLSRNDVRAARLALRSRGIEPLADSRIGAIHPLDEYAHIGAARVLIAEGQPAKAIVILDRIAERMRRDGRFRGFMQVRALVAIAAYAAGETLLALAAAVDIVTLALPQNAMRSLIDEGYPMREVLEFARGRIPAWSRNSETATFVDKLLREMTRTGSERTRPMAISRAPGKRMLSSKETDVAALLMRAYTNRQLAQTLSMAPDTVKWHLKNIFGKLGVSNRTAAVLKLKEIGLDSATERQFAG
jgi:LuxR family maltose regulon positive regulatory protein